MDDKLLLHCQQIAVQLATDAGHMITSASKLKKEVKLKEHRLDVVTETDRAVEQFLFTQLRQHFPNHRFIGEEGTSDQLTLTDDPTWIVDPIDGTMNFIYTFPFVCVSIGLTVNQRPVLGVIYSPFLNKLYSARERAGAQCNGRPIAVSKCQTLSKALVMFEIGPIRLPRIKNDLERIGWMCHGIRNSGSAALNLCMIAEGCADAYFDFGLHVWDITAGIAILTEAGGFVMDTEGEPIDILSRRVLAASNQTLANELSRNIQNHPRLPRD